MLLAENPLPSSGEGIDNFAMRGRHSDFSFMYKRGPSKDYINDFDREGSSVRLLNGKDIGNPSWKRSLPHILVATISSFLYGYHLGVVNETLESISIDLGFSGDTFAEGLVVSTCLGGAFFGSLFSGWVSDGLGRKRAFQLCALPMIIGASMSESQLIDKRSLFLQFQRNQDITATRTAPSAFKTSCILHNGGPDMIFDAINYADLTESFPSFDPVHTRVSVSHLGGSWQVSTIQEDFSAFITRQPVVPPYVNCLPISYSPHSSPPNDIPCSNDALPRIRSIRAFFCIQHGPVRKHIPHFLLYLIEAYLLFSPNEGCATTNSLWGMLLGRLFVGTGMGLGPPVASLYVAEVSPTFIRGTYGSFTQIATCLGLLGALFIGLPAKEIVDWWRVCFWVSIVPAVLLALCMEFCAESPHWLLKRGRGAEAEAEFERLLGGLHVKSAMAELSRSERGDEVDTVKLSELLYGRYFKVVFIGSTLFALQQLSGINAIFYFSTTVFKSFGVPSDLANICVGFSNLFGSVVATMLMDKLGRKVLLLGSFSGMVVSMALQIMATSSFASGSGALYLSVGGMLLFVFTFSLGAGPVPGLLLSEILPGRIRAKAMAVCMAVHWVINFFVGLLFLPLLERIGAGVLYSIFAAFCVLAVIFVKSNVLETKGKSLQEIEIALLPSE
uniref:Major facilitator superfamily (MFS) profile domain-containing protein n=1 Tax=Quercus lobata TaxID=97700 RepID=A0A7N2LP93_QUELO